MTTKQSKLRRGTGIDTERVSIHLPKYLAEGLRVLCARERRSLSNAVTLAVRRLLRSREPRPREDT